jgi:hypothetical protein
VFAESHGTGLNQINNNVVYGNRNFMPFFIKSTLAHFGSGTHSYGEWNMGEVIDGSGVYITRNPDYEGSFKLNNNKSYDNGINGLVVHKTTHENVSVEVKNNLIFDNGRTTKGVEGRQNAGGLAINSGGSSITSYQTLKSNRVTTQSGTGDSAYQCFGTCVLENSAWNKACGSDPSSKLDAGAFIEYDCDALATLNQETRDSYPDSQMPIEPQYQGFVDGTYDNSNH